MEATLMVFFILLHFKYGAHFTVIANMKCAPYFFLKCSCYLFFPVIKYSLMFHHRPCFSSYRQVRDNIVGKYVHSRYLIFIKPAIPSLYNQRHASRAPYAKPIERKILRQIQLTSYALFMNKYETYNVINII